MSYGFGFSPPEFPDALQNAQAYSLYSVTIASVTSMGLSRRAQQQLKVTLAFICNNKI